MRIEHKRATIEPIHPEVEIDLSVCVIPFAVGDHGLDVVLYPPGSSSGCVRLIRGSLGHGEHLTDCAARIAHDALATAPDYLEQLYTFSVSRGRVDVIVAYFALLSAETRAEIEREKAAAFSHVDRLEPLSDIDQRILDYAKMRLRAKLGYSNIGFYLLPHEFTLSELQDVYESIIGQKLDKRNFRRRILAAQIVEPTGAKRSTNHRPATLYRFTGGNPATGALTPAETDWSV